jgi:hypothetical protein
MPTIEDQITKTKERLAELEEKARQEQRKAELAREQGPSARAMNQLARDVRLADRAINMLIRVCNGEEHVPGGVTTLAAMRDKMLFDWCEGYRVKRYHALDIGDESELDKLDKPEKFIADFDIVVGA